MNNVLFPFEGVKECLVEFDARASMTLVRLEIQENMRQRGIGSDAIRFLKELARSYRVRTIRVTPQPSDGDASNRLRLVRFYRKNGFRFKAGDNDVMYCDL